MIVVATADFEVYHEVVTALRERNVAFTTIEPGDSIPERTTVLVTGRDDDLALPAVGSTGESAIDSDELQVVRADPGDPRQAVEDILSELRRGEGRTVVGIDPGERPGIAVLSGDTIAATFQVPAERVGDVVAEEVADAVDPLVRIGDGARLIGAQLVDDMPDVPVELVDESGTTPYLGTGARGMGDVLAAANIARRSGERIEGREVEPTAGELKQIKARSREESEANRAIDEALARQVATGDLSLREALEAHRDDG